MRLAVPIILLASLAACTGSYDPDRCSTASGPKAEHVSDAGQTCIVDWSRKLAASTDPARDVADAVLVACQDTIGKDDELLDGVLENSSTGTTREASTEARHLAVFRVVEERAGHCSLKK